MFTTILARIGLFCGLVLTIATAPVITMSDRSCRENTQVDASGDVACNTAIDCDQGGDICDEVSWEASNGYYRFCACGGWSQEDDPTDDGICHAYAVITSSGNTRKCMPDSQCIGAEECNVDDTGLAYQTCSCQ